MPSPLDPTQLRWWHRIRRRRAVLFVVVLGALGASVVVTALTGLSWHGLYGVPFSWTRLLVVFALLAPIHAGAFAWTWSFMERRYRASLGVRCPGCGYDLRASATDRCPECGAPIERRPDDTAA